MLQHDAVYTDAAEHRDRVSEVLPWIPELQLDLAFRMDALAWVMSLLVLGVGALVLVYCARYFETRTTTSADSARGCWPSPARCSASSRPMTCC